MSVDPAVPIVSELFEALPLGFALLGGDGRITRCNQAFVASFGLGENGNDARWFGIDPATLVLDADRPAFIDAIARILNGDGAVHELRVRLAPRPEETIVLTLAERPTSTGRAVLLAVRDIREQLRLEQQVAQVTKMQAVGQLAGGVAHDFNNILTAVLGLCDQLLTRHAPGSEDFDDIDQIRQNANRAAALVRQLLAFARQQTLRPQLLDVAAIITGLQFLLQRLIGPTVVLATDYGADIRRVRADPGQLEQVIVNLAVNARDAMAEGGTLTFALRNVLAAEVGALGHRIMPHSDFVEIGVCDTGSGIAPEISARIFEPFFTTKDIGKGTGLGLSTVYGIVKQTGGFIFVAPHPPRGTRFTVYLPAARAGELSAPPPVAAAVRAVSASALLVEDERAVRQVVERALRLHGMTVYSAEDAEAAAMILDEHGADIDLMISDVVMPGVDGVTLMNTVRARFPAMAVILMSGYAEPPLRREAGRQETVFLSKPFAIAALLGAVERALAVAA